MSRRRPPVGDPRKLGGDIAGPGGPHGKGDVIIDARNAVLMEHVNVAQVDNPSDGRKAVALVLEGRINQSSDRTRVLYLFDADGAAALVTQLIALGGRSDAPWAHEFSQMLESRFKELQDEGNLAA